MFTSVRTTTTLSLDEHFIKHTAATFFVKVEGDGMEAMVYLRAIL
jgi:SOS-response transcriptional repressor LexA